MKRFALLFVLFALSAAAQAEWARIGSNSRGTSYLWNPVKQYFPYAYPAGAAIYNASIPVGGWAYRARSAYSESVVDCRDGRAKLRRGILYSGRYLTGASVRVAYLILDKRPESSAWTLVSVLPIP